MKSIPKITGYNLLVMLVYSAVIRATSSGNEKSLSILLLSAFVIAIHVAVLLIISVVLYINKKPEEGKAVLLSTGLILLIGFSSCWANASV